jgi:hypothetical protein
VVQPNAAIRRPAEDRLGPSPANPAGAISKGEDAVRVRFQKVEVIARKTWKDANGKRHQETRRFWQTLSPFNTDADGNPKSREQVMREIMQERKEWLAGFREQAETYETRG